MFKQAIAPVLVPIVLAGVATITIFAIPGAAMAEPVSTSAEVKLADINLASPDGQKVLERRIDRAARHVCGVDDRTTGTRIPSREANVCYRQALRDVRTQVAAVINNRRAGS